ncbi:MAG: phosphatidylglycerophosphatase A [Ignavibacteriales bacterium]|nr:phosphatidylglycerophosphatase A [Ignavibacteriales bacterium]
MNTLEKFLGSGFYTGYIPFASGTFGSLSALLIYWIPGFEQPVIIIPAIVFVTLYGIVLGNKFEKVYGKDPSECTIDEVSGMWISLLFLPKTIILSIVAFFIWRALDIFKPYPANRFEKFNGGTGIMLDDVMSGIYTCLIMQIILKIFY